MVNASDSGSRGRGFEPHSGQTVSVLEQGTFTPQKVLVSQEAVAPSQHD